MKRFKCTSSVCLCCTFEPCDYIYDEAKGDKDNGVLANTKFNDLPKDWTCPECGAGPESFKEIEEK